MKVVEQPNLGGYIAGVGETASFKMAVNGPLMRNMLTNIYSNKEKTVVRELMANAFDAHTARNIDDPVSVCLPTSLDPTFSVRDYGVGMRHEFVMDLYTTIGYSTKDDSNDMTGMFGVGSKSPFAICDTFTVRCFDPPGWNNAPFVNANGIDLNETGRIRLYAVSFSDKDIPQIHHTFDVLPKDKDEIARGGVEVKVPIKPTIRDKVLEGITEQHFCWFDKPVQFHGAFDEVESKLLKSITHIGADFYIASGDKTHNYAGTANVYIRQGFAVYKAELHLLKIPDNVTKVLEALCSQTGRAVLIDVPIGTADVTMARENLQYNETSVNNISTIISQKTVEFFRKLEDTIGDAKDYRAAFERLCESGFEGKINKDDFSGRKAVADLVKLLKKRIIANYDAWHDTLPDVERKRIKYDSDGKRCDDPVTGKPIMEAYMDRPEKNHPHRNVILRGSAFPESKVILHSASTSVYSSGGLSRFDLNQEISVPLVSLIYVMPSHTNDWKGRIQRHIEKQFGNPKGFASTPVFAVRVPKKLMNEAQDYIKKMGAEYYLFTDEDLPPPEISAQTARTYSKTSVYEWSVTDWSAEKVEPDYTKKAYYVTRVGISHDCFSRHPARKYAGTANLRLKYSSRDITDIISYANHAGYLDNSYPIYRVTENQADKIARTAPEWEHLIETIAVQVEADILADSSSALSDSVLSTYNDYEVRKFIDAAMSASGDKDDAEYERLAHEALTKLVQHDEGLLYVVATRWAKGAGLTQKDESHAGKYSLAQRLFIEVPTNPASKIKTETYDALFNTTHERHPILTDLITACAPSWARPSRLCHLLYYVNGYVASAEPYKIPANTLLDLRPFVDVFLERLENEKISSQDCTV